MEAVVRKSPTFKVSASDPACQFIGRGADSRQTLAVLHILSLLPPGKLA